MLRTTILTFLLLAVLSVPALAQTKIATVDMEKLFKGYWKTKQAEVALNKRVTDLQKEIKDMADGLDKAQADYNQLLDQANDQALSAEERGKRKEAAADKLKEMNNSKGAIDQFNRQAQSQVLDQRQRMTANLLSEIQKAVGDKAKAGSYTLVVNSAITDAVVYSSGDDLSDAVLKQLNAGAPIDVTPPAAITPISTLLSSTNGPALDFNSH
ncbi:MAG: OmpH family outer membrane protein [Verrucomicrobiota bacterium]